MPDLKSRLLTVTILAVFQIDLVLSQSILQQSPSLEFLGAINSFLLWDIITLQDLGIFVAIWAGFYYASKPLLSELISDMLEVFPSIGDGSRHVSTSNTPDNVEKSVRGLSLVAGFVAAQYLGWIIGGLALIIIGSTSLIAVTLYLVHSTNILKNEIRRQNQRSVNQLQAEVERTEQQTDELEEEVEQIEKDIENTSDSDKAEKEVDTTLEKLKNIVNLLESEEDKINQITSIEKQELEEAFQTEEELKNYQKTAEAQLNQLSGDLSDLIYQAMEETATQLSSEEYSKRSKKYLKKPELLERDLDNKFSIPNNVRQKYRNEDYLDKLDDIRKSLNAKTQQIDFSKAEKVIQQNKQTLREFRELKQEVQEAFEEETELKEIMEKLGDEQKWNSEGEELDAEIKQLKDNFQQAKKREERIQELEDKIKQLKDNEGSIKTFKDIEERIEKINQVINLIGKENSDSASPQMPQNWDAKGKEWRHLLDNPNDHCNSSINLSSYDTDTWFSTPESFNADPLIAQGFKIHISAYPAEGYEVAKAIIPVLQELGVFHKVMHSQKFHRGKIPDTKKDRENSLQIKKFMTIYPGVPANDVHLEFEKAVEGQQSDKNIPAMYKNKNKTIKVLKELKDNVPPEILTGGPKVEGERRRKGIKFRPLESRIGKTRMHTRYASMNPDKPVSIAYNGRKVDRETYQRSEDSIRSNFLDFYVQNGSITKDQAQKIKNKIKSGRWTGIVGLDGYIGGAYYLPPPETWKEVDDIISRF